MSALSVGIEIVGDGLDAATSHGAGVARLAGRLDNAGVAYWVIGAERGERPAAAHVTLDASLVATVAARHTERLGLVVAAAAHRDHPYNLARRLVSVDHAARGRVGWLALDADHTIALNADTDVWTHAPTGHAHTGQAVAAVRTLWRSWPLTSIVGDRHTGVFSDVRQIRRADIGDGYSIAGPLNVPGSRQGDLPVWRTASPGDGADVVIVEDGQANRAGSAAPAVVVRLRTTENLAAALDRLAGTPAVAGALLRVTSDELPGVLDGVLPAARRRGVLGSADGLTLRDRLGLPPPAVPDLSDHAIAFAGTPNPGARL